MVLNLSPDVDAMNDSKPMPSAGAIRLFILPLCAYGIALWRFVSRSNYILYDFPLDDAWIHRVYSSSFAFGHGFQYNSGVQEAGSTSPLWAMVSAPAHWLFFLGQPAVTVAVKCIAAALGLCVLLEIVRLGTLLAGSRKGAVFAATLFALEPRFLFSVFSGMETILLVALWTGGVRFYLERRWALSALWFGLAPLARPEALLVLPFCLLGLVFLKQDERPSRAQLLCGTALLVLPTALWALFSLAVTGHPLPNTFYIKSRAFHLGAKELAAATIALIKHGFGRLTVFLVGLGAALAYCIARFQFRTAALALFLLVAPLLFVLGIAGTRILDPYGYYWTRWIDPAGLMLTMYFCLGMGAMFSDAFDFVRSKAWAPRNFVLMNFARGAACLVGLLLLALSVRILLHSLEERRERLHSDSRAVRIMNVEPGLWIDKNVLPSARIAVNDAGALRYFGKRWTLDLLGLNHANLAFRKKTQAELIQEKSVQWLVVFPDWFKGSPILKNFVSRRVIKIPAKEYTICRCPQQTHVEIYQKNDAGGSMGK